jgi:hypothetical protein
MEDKLLFLLIYLKTMPLQETHGQLFGMRQSQVNPWMHLLVPIVNHALADCGELPARQMEALDMSEDQTKLFFHDGTERAINRPKDPQEQKLSYSGKQKQHTLKHNVLINDACTILFVTDTVAGKKHEKQLADEAGYRVPEGSVLLQDTGFQGFTLNGVVILQPNKKPKGSALSSIDNIINRLIASIRIRIEHAISGVKRYRMVKDTLRNWKTGFRDLVFETCWGLHNFRLHFRPWHYETPAYLDYLVKS